MSNSAIDSPKRVLVVGAGMVGLSCAWSLQQHGIEVEVVDRLHPAAGASWGNAGYVSPSHATPLPEPAILRYGVRAVLDPRSPVSLPVRGDMRRARFLAGMVRHCTSSAWERAMAAYRPLNELAISAYDDQHAGGVTTEAVAGDLLSACVEPEQASAILDELRGIAGIGQEIDIDLLTGDQARQLEPHLSSATRVAVLIKGQRYIQPAQYVAALAKSVTERGATIADNTEVSSVSRRGERVVAETHDGAIEADAVVIANGAWMSDLASSHGVRVPVHAGRGYSFTLPTSTPFVQPLHFPGTRLALTPAGDRVRVVGIMEFTEPGAPFAQSRIRSMLAALRPLIRDVDFDGRADDWVGSRPLTTDGMPLIGQTATDGVYVAGGHGMWGITLGPVTGRLLAEQIATGTVPAALRPFDPLRS